MSSELSTSQSIMLSARARVTVREPTPVRDSDSWVIHIEAVDFPHGSNYTAYFGTEAQVRAIAGGYRAAEEVTTDPAQLDALEEAAATPDRPPMTDLGAQAFDLGVALNKIGTVASW